MNDEEEYVEVEQFVGKVIRVPISVSETEYIKIVADQRHCLTNNSRDVRWEMLAVTYDPDTGRNTGEAFAITQKEIVKWNAATL